MKKLLIINYELLIKAFNNSKANLTIFVIAMLFLLSGTFINGCKEKSDMKTTENNPVLLPVKEDPTISFKIWFKVGSQNDPKGKEGLAMLTANLISGGGTLTNDYDKILEKLYPMAASYSSNVDKEMTTISGRIHKDNLNDYYALFTEALLKPAFKDEDFNRLKSNMINYLEKEIRYSSDEELGKASLYEFVFENTPYSHIAEGTVEGMKSITIDDVKNFYKKFYTKENFVIGLGGGYDGQLLPKLEKDLALLPSGKVEQIQKPAPAKIEGLEFLLVEKECDASAISFGFPIDVLRGDEDFFALALFNSWFGEHRDQSSHLYSVIREKRGMNYGDYSYIETFLNGGALSVPEPNNPRRQQIFEVWLRPVQNQNRHFALRAALRELKKVVDNGLTQKEFDLTKMFLYNYSLFYARTTMSRLGYEIDSKFYGLNDGENYIEYFRKKINGLTLDQVNKAIKKHIQYNNLKIAVVTNDAEKFKEELVNNVPSPIKYVSPVGNDVLEEDKIIEVFPLKVKAEKVKIIKVDDMFVK